MAAILPTRVRWDVSRSAKYSAASGLDGKLRGIDGMQDLPSGDLRSLEQNADG